MPDNLLSRLPTPALEATISAKRVASSQVAASMRTAAMIDGVADGSTTFQMI